MGKRLKGVLHEYKLFEVFSLFLTVHEILNNYRTCNSMNKYIVFYPIPPNYNQLYIRKKHFHLIYALNSLSKFN